MALDGEAIQAESWPSWPVPATYSSYATNSAVEFYIIVDAAFIMYVFFPMTLTIKDRKSVI